MSKKSFIKGAAILAVAGLISKFIGAFFRIPLYNIIDDDGIGLYQLAYPIYAFMLIISTAGIPIAISKLVSEKLAMGNYREAHRVFKVSFRLMLGIGVISFIILSTGSGLAASLVGSERARLPILAITPCLIFVSLISAYRGYFQGMQIMTPTAVSQIVEQVGKLVLGLWFASMWIHRGVEYGAVAAVIGVTLSEGAALVLLAGIYQGKKKEIYNRIRKSPRQRYSESDRSILMRLSRIAIPITIGASIMPLINVADVVIVVNRLTGIGFSQVEAERLFGMLSGGANPLINFPAVLTIALAMSLVPAISESYANKDHKSIASKTTTGIRLTLLLGMPSAAGLAVLAHPISELLYRSQAAESIATIGDILRVLALGVVFLTLVQTLTSVLQGIGKIAIPVRNLFIGALFKIVITYVLVGNPTLHVKGAAIGTVVCYGVAAVLDFVAVIRYTKISISLVDFIIKPFVSVSVMAGIVWAAYYSSVSTLGNTRATLVAILAGTLVYGAMLILIGAVKQEDFELLPAGTKIGKILTRLGIIKD